MSKPSGCTAHQIPICVNLSVKGHCLFLKKKKKKMRERKRGGKKASLAGLINPFVVNSEAKFETKFFFFFFFADVLPCQAHCGSLLKIRCV